MRRASLAVLFLLAGPACAQEADKQAAATQDAIPRAVRAVIERSRNPTADYTVFTVDRVTQEGQRFIQTNAEYHRGTRRRVETRPARVLIDCATGNTIYRETTSGRVERLTGGQSVCGIADAELVLSGRMLAPVTGSYGRADVIELTGPDFVRRYTVTHDGIIAANSYTPRRPDVPYAVENLHSEVTRGSPAAALFEESSLARAYAPPPEALMSAVPSP